MNMPGFTATSTLVNQYRQRIIPALKGRDPGDPSAGPPLSPRMECILDCLDDCIDVTSEQCHADCGQRCRDAGTYQCTERDNSYNYYLDQAGIWAWEQACKLDCSLFLPEAICDSICGSLANDMRKTAQPKTICV